MPEVTHNVHAAPAPVAVVKPADIKKPAKPTGISTHILVYIAWRNLISRKLRTLLTVFGVTIGIGAIFFLLSFGLGLHNLVTSQIIGDKSIKSIDVLTPNSKILHLDTQLVNELRLAPHVSAVGTSYSFPGSIAYKGGNVDAVSYGVDQNFEQMESLNLVKGRLLTDNDTQQVVLNLAALKTIGITKAADAIGQSININIPLRDQATNKQAITGQYKIVGVVDADSGSELFISNGIFQAAGVKYFSQIKLTVDDSNKVASVRKNIESQGYQTNSPIDTLNQINQIFRVFTALLVGFGGIGMIVSILGMFNTLTISLLERTKEIGLMMLMGGRASDMRRLFVYEATLLSIFGAALGIIFAILFGQLIDGFMNAFAHHRGVDQTIQLFSAPLWAVASSILFMVLVGLAVVHFPAERAKKINPIVALRRE